MKVIASSLAVSAVAFKSSTQPNVGPDFSTLPSFAEGYTEKLINNLCHEGANPAETQGCAVWSGAMQEVLKKLYSATECPATNFDDKACKACFDQVTENNPTWLGLEASEKAWLGAYLSLNANDQDAYNLEKVDADMTAAVEYVEGQTPRGRHDTKDVPMNRGGNNSGDSQEVNSMFAVQTEIMLCALRIAAKDGCGAKLEAPSCTP